MDKDEFKIICQSIIKASKPYEMMTACHIYFIIKNKTKITKSFFEFKEILRKLVSKGPFYIYVKSKDNISFYFYKSEDANWNGIGIYTPIKMILIIKDILTKNSDVTREDIKEKLAEMGSERNMMDMFVILRTFGFIVKNRKTFCWNDDAERNISQLKNELMKDVDEDFGDIIFLD